jgi:hypothetical protein
MEQYPARPVACESPAWHDCYSDYYIEPKFNGWRILIDQERQEVYGRKGIRSALEQDVLERIQNAKIHSRWIDGEWLGQRTEYGKGSFIVIDACEPVPYDKRRKLFEHLEVASFEPKRNALMRMPNLDHSKLMAIWQEMDFQNNKAGETIFEGFVMKKDTKYPWTQKPSYFSPQWHKMRMRS